MKTIACGSFDTPQSACRKRTKLVGEQWHHHFLETFRESTLRTSKSSCSVLAPTFYPACLEPIVTVSVPRPSQPPQSPSHPLLRAPAASAVRFPNERFYRPGAGIPGLLGIRLFTMSRGHRSTLLMSVSALPLRNRKRLLRACFESMISCLLR